MILGTLFAGVAGLVVQRHAPLVVAKENDDAADEQTSAAGTAEHDSLTVRGRVVDPGGRPVAGALVVYGNKPFWEPNPQYEVHSDEKGNYQLPPLPRGTQRLTVVASGWMPEMRLIEIELGLRPQDFQLRPGKALRVRVVDVDGRPLKSVLKICGWRGIHSLPIYGQVDAPDSRVPCETGADGVYQWTYAPDDAVRFQIWAGDDYVEPQEAFVADGQQHDLTLLPVLRIRGKVIDAKTNKPIDRFVIVPVQHTDHQTNFHTSRRRARQCRGGSYLLDRGLDQIGRSYRVRVEAEGYLSALSEPFHVGDRGAAVDFRLKKATAAATGRIVDTQGKPVVGAKVFLGSRTQPITRPDELDSGNSWNNFRLASGPSGEFTFPAQFEPFAILALHDVGFAEAKFEADSPVGTIQLQSYARVSGRLWQAGKPVPGAQINLNFSAYRSGDEMNIDRDDSSVKTDDQGRFVFEKVPARKCMVWAELSPWKEFPITSSQVVPLDLKPAQEIALELGGGGVSVTGRVEMASTQTEKVDMHWSLNWLLRKIPGIEPSAKVAQCGFDWRKGLDTGWTDTSEGQAYLATLYHDAVLLSRDGDFSINGLPFGEYELALRIYRHEDPQACLVNPIARHVVKFQVTSVDIARGNLDLGRLEVEPIVDLKPGDTIANFGFQLLTGKSKKLGEVEGRFLLLDFGAGWCARCQAQMPELRQLAEKHRTADLTIVSLSLDADLEAAREAHVDSGPAIQAFLPDGTENPVATRLGISSLPTYLLLDANRKLILQAYSPAQIDQKLTEVEAIEK